jgi:hypothetical protein
MQQFEISAACPRMRFSGASAGCACKNNVHLSSFAYCLCSPGCCCRTQDAPLCWCLHLVRITLCAAKRPALARHVHYPRMPHLQYCEVLGRERQRTRVGVLLAYGARRPAGLRRPGAAADCRRAKTGASSLHDTADSCVDNADVALLEAVRHPLADCVELAAMRSRRAPAAL